jgi:hypothetical protein
MLDGMHRELSAMPKDSGRNNKVFEKALKIGNFFAGAGLDQDRAVRTLLDACNHNGIVSEDSEQAVLASIESGIRKGKARPRAVPESGYHQDRPEGEPDPSQVNEGDDSPFNRAEELAAFWRRVRLIPFLQVVPEEQQIKDLDQLLLAEEGPAIFGWCARGAVEVIANGLQDPEPVIQATENYEVSEDTVASFNRDHCFLGPSCWCFVSDYRAQYEEHCKDMGIKESDILSAKALTIRLTTEYGVIDGKRLNGRRIYQGIGLRAQHWI